ncbi:MAG TPA: DUF748 domain-containing protein, partial [Thermoanaerobaculia bacterium]|nr:DUF748 domain-containing protein [Thermoanaerobaculia bacterium]
MRTLPISARTRRWLAWIAAFVAVVAVLGFLVAPPIVRSQAEKVLADSLHRPVSIENVRVNPFAPSVTVAGLAVKERDGSTVVAGFDELYVRLSYTSIFRLAPVVSAVRLEKPVLRVVRRPDRTYNFQDLVDELLARKPAEGREPVRFSVNNIQVLDGRITFDDAVAGEKHEVAGLRVGIPFVSSLPSQVDIDVEPELSATVDGAPVAIRGDTHPFKDTNETNVEVNLDALPLPKLADYSPVPLRFRLDSGLLDTRIRIRFVTRDAKPVGLAASGGIGISKLAIADRAGSPLVAFERLAVDVETIDVFGREARVRSVRLDRPVANVVRSKEGGLNLVEALPLPSPATATDATPPTPEKPFAFAVEDVTVAGGKASLVDLSVTPRAFRTELEAIDVGVKGLSSRPDSRAQVTARFTTDGLGAFRHEGTLGLSPVVAEGRVAGEGFRLARIYPYLEPVLNVDIAEGSLDFEAGYALAFAGDSPELRVSGASATLRSVALRYPGEKEAFLRLPLAEASDASADLAMRRVRLGQVIAKGGALAAHREADGTLRFSRLIRRQSE